MATKYLVQDENGEFYNRMFTRSEIEGVKFMAETHGHDITIHMFESQTRTRTRKQKEA